MQTPTSVIQLFHSSHAQLCLWLVVGSGAPCRQPHCSCIGLSLQPVHPSQLPCHPVGGLVLASPWWRHSPQPPHPAAAPPTPCADKKLLRAGESSHPAATAPKRAGGFRVSRTGVASSNSGATCVPLASTKALSCLPQVQLGAMHCQKVPLWEPCHTQIHFGVARVGGMNLCIVHRGNYSLYLIVILSEVYSMFPCPRHLNIPPTCTSHEPSAATSISASSHALPQLLPSRQNTLNVSSHLKVSSSTTALGHELSWPCNVPLAVCTLHSLPLPPAPQ
jgi:hypothetical protein